MWQRNTTINDKQLALAIVRFSVGDTVYSSNEQQNKLSLIPYAFCCGQNISMVYLLTNGECHFYFEYKKLHPERQMLTAG